MAGLKMGVATETLRLKKPFRISNFVWESSDVVVVTLDDGEARGRGEGGGVFFLGDDVVHMRSVLEEYRAAIEAGPSRSDLRSIMPAGGARNAVHCAPWELEAVHACKPGLPLAGVSAPRPAATTLMPRPVPLGDAASTPPDWSCTSAMPSQLMLRSRA